MKLLLDAHALLWFLDTNTSLSHRARAAIENPANETHISHVTAWEVAIKVGLGKLGLTVPYMNCSPAQSCRMVSTICRRASLTFRNC